MIYQSSTGMSPERALRLAGSVLREARARAEVCPWCLRNIADVELAETRVLAALDAFIAATTADMDAFDAMPPTFTERPTP